MNGWTRKLLATGLWAIFVAQLAWAAGPTEERIVPLGRLQGREARAVVTIQRLAGEPANVVSVRVHYVLGAGKNAQRTNAMDAGESYAEEIRMGAYSFTSNRGGKRLFLSTTLGRVRTHIYELSGARLGALYSREGGRVMVRPVRNGSGGYDLEESWPRNHWEDRENLGVGTYDARTNCVRRRLHWNGKAFVPLQPDRSGDSAIFRLSRRESDAEREDAVREAVFRVLFARTPTKSNPNPPLSGENNSVWKTFFIEVDEGREPSARLLKRFKGNQPPVKPVSASFFDPKAKDFLMYAVKDKKIKEIGIIFRVGKLCWLNRHRVQVQAGYYAGGLNGFSARFTLVREGGRWRLKGYDHVIVS